MGSDSGSRLIRILITTGDTDGIGLEVTQKALRQLGHVRGVQFFYFRTPGSRSESRSHHSVENLEEAVRLPAQPGSIVEILSPESPARWVEESARACLAGRFQALVTAPLSKTSIVAAGLKDIGHTEILARVSKTKNLFMGFVGPKFSVVLATGHSPLAKALKEFDSRRLKLALQAAMELRRGLPARIAARPMAVVGVNPHAGEGGLIGKDEVWMRRAVRQSAKLGVEGPLVPDAAFLPQNWERYSVFVCPYHDQGLIPFKMIHGFSRGVHLTLGLPFVRTSVDHGTAKELFGKDKADCGSMKDAIETAIRLVKERT